MAEVKPGLFVDNDGTLFKSSLVEKVIDEAVRRKIFHASAFQRAGEIREQWQDNNREGTYAAYIEELVDGFAAQIAGVKVADMNAVVEAVVAGHKARRHKFPRILMRSFQDSHEIIVISGSPIMSVAPFVQDLPVARVFGATFDEEDGVFTGEATPSGDKNVIRQKLIDKGLIAPENNIAIGDTMGDQSILRAVKHPVILNPSQTLADYGSEMQFPKVLETKDNITVLQWTNGRYVETSVDALLRGIQSDV